MSFRLWTIFYVFALVAAAMATFGGWGIVVAVIVLLFWAKVFYAPTKPLTLVELLVIICVLGMFIGLLMPAVSTSRGAARRNQCTNNLKQLALAILNYESATGALPPAYVADAAGEPMHSWRTLVLPYLEEMPLYRRYNFNEPWDGPNNRKLASLMPDVYRCPSQSDGRVQSAIETNYFMFARPRSISAVGSARTFRSITDGMANTLMLIEASGLRVHWMEPRDVTADEAVELLTTKPRSGHSHVHEGFFTTTIHETAQRNVVFFDGHTVHMGQFSNAAIAKALLTIAGGEVIPPNLNDEYKPDVVTTVVNWRNIYALSLFVILTLLPAAWLRKQRTRSATKSVHEENDIADGQSSVQNISII
jgi:prepilin-type processing-associated H-X9-DG protein